MTLYACERDGNKLHFHVLENSKTSNVDRRSGFCVAQVNATVPDYN